MQAGPLLSEWRRNRRLSQLDLAMRAEVSSRHLSFVETGRAQPSAGLLQRLAEALDLSCRDTNHLLVAAGHPPRFSETRLDDPAMAPVRRALRRRAEPMQGRSERADGNQERPTSRKWRSSRLELASLQQLVQLPPLDLHLL